MEHHIFHVDVNSAYLSWNALWEKRQGRRRDLRKLPAVVAGDPKSRRGVILAKSTLAKSYGIVTGEPLFQAQKKCPGLIVVAPERATYREESRKLMSLLTPFAKVIEQFSIDECFLDMGEISRQQALLMAKTISQKVFQDLGFTVNIGIGLNKLCAKMASDFEKPNRIHTLYPEEIEEKFHPLPIGHLYLVGNAMEAKLRSINLKTIGQLAHCDPAFLQQRFGKMGTALYRNAWGQGEATLTPTGTVGAKTIGHSTTLAEDALRREDCHKVIERLTKKTAQRLITDHYTARTITVQITSSDFVTKSHQMNLVQATDSLPLFLDRALRLFDHLWQGQPLRKIGVSLSHFGSSQEVQLSLLDVKQRSQDQALKDIFSEIHQRFGNDAIATGRKVFGPKEEP